jgi:hypothetical protein
MTQILNSALVERQLPSFVRDEYSTFVVFLKKYYEWLEQQNNLSNVIQNFSNSLDVDLSSDYYLEFIKQELAPYFPEELLLDKSKFVKFLNQFYRAKGTPNSVKFLFRVLYGENIEIYYPKEDVLIASDGKWVLPLALRVDTDDNNIFNLTGVRIKGVTSQATAIVENIVQSIDRQLGIEYIELYISNVNKLFATGEQITGSYTDNGNTVTVTGRLIGSLSELKINPDYRGLFYNGYDTTTGYQGDPVTILGGLNPTSGNPVGAIATVGEVTKGSVTEVSIINGGFGFRDPAINVNSSIIDFVGGFENSVFGQETRASISLIDSNTYRTVNVSDTSIETIGLSLTLDQAANTSNIENCTINFITTTQSLNVFPISYIVTDGSGGGYRTTPTPNFYSFYLESENDISVISSTSIVASTNVLRDESQDLTSTFEAGDYIRLFVTGRFEEIRVIDSVTSNTITVTGAPFQNDISNVRVYKILRRPLNDVGALGRIVIENGGDGYNVGEYLVFTGGTGYGANAVITEVHVANNGIKTVEFNDDGSIIKGGEGYKQDRLPTITVNTASGANASLYVSEILGKGVDVDLFTSRIGAISTLRVVSYGYDYVEAPTISLRNADLTVANVTEGLLFVSNTIIYQGESNANTTFSATVEKYTQSSGLLRVFNYRGTLNVQQQIISDTDPVVTANVNSTVFYGDGKARATAKFENGLIRYPGIYLNTDGQVSSDKKLQDGTKYHNYSYIIKTENDYAKFKKTLNEVVHPIGMKAFVTRIDTNEETAANVQIETMNLIRFTLANTVNIVADSNTIIGVGSNPDFANTINVGDMIIVTDLTRFANGTVNVTSSSNVITGTNTTFINDIQDGDLIYISSGNTETVTFVTNASSLITQNTISVTDTDLTINLIYDEIKTVTSVNSNTIFVDSTFTTSGVLKTAILQKVE